MLGMVHGYFEDKDETKFSSEACSRYDNSQANVEEMSQPGRRYSVSSMSYSKSQNTEVQHLDSIHGRTRPYYGSKDQKNEEDWGVGNFCFFKQKKMLTKGYNNQLQEISEKSSLMQESRSSKQSSFRISKGRAGSCPADMLNEKERERPMGNIVESGSQTVSQNLRRMLIKRHISLEMKLKSAALFRKFKQELKAAKILGLIMGTFFVLWAPFMLYAFIDSLGIPVSYDIRIALVLKDLHYSNSAINPMLYVVLNKQFLNGVRKILVRIGILKKKADVTFL